MISTKNLNPARAWSRASQFIPVGPCEAEPASLPVSKRDIVPDQDRRRCIGDQIRGRKNLVEADGDRQPQGVELDVVAAVRASIFGSV